MLVRISVPSSHTDRWDYPSTGVLDAIQRSYIMSRPFFRLIKGASRLCDSLVLKDLDPNFRSYKRIHQTPTLDWYLPFYCTVAILSRYSLFLFLSYCS